MTAAVAFANGLASWQSWWRYATRRPHGWKLLVLKRLLRSAAVQAFTARLVGLYLDFALRTTRWTLVGEEHAVAATAGHPHIAAFWHERLPLLPALWFIMRRKGATGTPRVLVSKHRDGRFIGAVVRRFGVEVVHGSSSKDGSARDVSEKGGAASVRVLLGELQAGQHILITPDGPRGPRRRAAPGVAQIAALSGAPILPVGAQTSRHRILPTWDKMLVPLPFGRGVIVCGPPLLVPRDGWEASVPLITAALTEAADRADDLCPS
ncbi:lysophospholipid acyltransferase family protein [Acidisphaera sp. L21]|uniref:lysophospholipid acyltransferase family protein n=1 Tax=Acidisphaera sp. L21 TaxID=1641851 RepID=UPI00131D5027|nr:lysophospholipid acyltransferase family protein [Acidisphaera sp. L21]